MSVHFFAGKSNVVIHINWNKENAMGCDTKENVEFSEAALVEYNCLSYQHALLPTSNNYCVTTHCAECCYSK